MENRIKNMILEQGADLCGIASIDRFLQAPSNFNPCDIYMNCRSVIAFGKRLPRGIAHVNPRIIYNQFTEINIRELDRIALIASIEIENMGGIAVPLPTDSPYEYWEKENLTGKGLISMRHAAVMCGLGGLGKNTLVINKTYGNMLNFGAVLTNLELKSDPLSEEMCIETCNRCLENCPTKALNGKTVSQKLCRPNAYDTNDRGFGVVNCNKCRISCPRVFGINDHLEI